MYYNPPSKICRQIIIKITCSGVKGIFPEQMSDLKPMTLCMDKHLDCCIAVDISFCESVGENPIFGLVQLQGLKCLL